MAPNRPYFPEEDRREIREKIGSVLESGQLTLGQYTKEFEQLFAAQVGIRYSVAVSSGTAALEIICRYLEVDDKEVIVPTNTFIATPNAVTYAGGTPIFADISKKTLCLDAPSLRNALERSTHPRAVTIVHIGGLVTPEMHELKEICEEWNVPLVEDAAHAHGASYDGVPAGSFGFAAAFSFFPTKVMTCSEGGMIVTEDPNLAVFARSVRDQGKSSYNPDLITRYGHNWRMSEIHALLGIYQLKRLREFMDIRSRIAEVYNEELEALSPRLIPLEVPPKTTHSFYKYVALLSSSHEGAQLKPIDRNRLKQILLERSKLRLAGEVYAIPCHEQPIYRRVSRQRLPVAEDACRSHICLPIHAAMSEDDALYVASALKQAVEAL